MNNVRIDTEHLRQYVTDAELQQIACAWGAPWYKDPKAGNGYPILQWQFDRGDYPLICGFPEDEASSISEESLTPNPSPRERGTLYDLQGRKVKAQPSNLNSQLKKGIYIINGKKVVY